EQVVNNLQPFMDFGTSSRCAHPKVLSHRHFWEQPSSLGNICDAHSYQCVGSHPIDSGSFEDYLSSLSPYQTHDRLEQSRLPSPIRANNRNNFSGFCAHRYVPQYPSVTI